MDKHSKVANSFLNHKLNLSKLMPVKDEDIKILNERAKALAKVKKDNQVKNTEMIHYIQFVIGNNEYYGIPYQYIQNVNVIEYVTYVPNLPAYMAGVSYWQGKIIPILNLEKYFNLTTNEIKRNNIIIATVVIDKLIMGLIFNQVIGVDSYLDDQLDKNILTDQIIKNQYVLGIHLGKIAILNLRNILLDVSVLLINDKEK